MSLKFSLLRYYFSIFLILSMAACANKISVPVVERSASNNKTVKVTTAVEVGGKSAIVSGDPREAFYTVKTGDTLYSIALEHGQYYRDVAAWNNLESPALIKVGQVLRILPPITESNDNAVAIATPVKLDTVQGQSLSSPSLDISSQTHNTATYKEGPKGEKIPYSDQDYARMNGTSPMASATPTTIATVKNEALTKTEADKNNKTAWIWPATGKISEVYSEGRNKGMDIMGKSGDPVVAVADGRVVYSGNGLRGYGNLIVLRHDQDYSSVYAHNQKILVNEGQEVKRGQKIAEMGATDTEQTKLHFEVRFQGKPTDPLKFLPER